MQTPNWSFRALPWIALLLLGLQGGSAALAQAPAQPAPAAQPTAQPTAQPAPTEPALPPEASPAAAPPVAPPCFPACRDGFVCGTEGQCISACNPPCNAGERCTSQGQCTIDAQASMVTPPALSYPAPYPPGAPSAPAVPEKGAETHDGVLLRFTVGIGGGAMNETADGSDSEIDYSSGGVMWAVDIGAGITDELTMQARLGQTLLFEPSREIDGEKVDLEEGRNLSATLFGAGLTYHFMPINMYVTAIGGLSDLRITDGSDPDDDDYYVSDDPTVGFGLNLDVGKEWWVVPQTGIGVAGRLVWMTGGAEVGYDASGREITTDRSLIAFGVVFSVTHQ